MHCCLVNRSFNLIKNDMAIKDAITIAVDKCQLVGDITISPKLGLFLESHNLLINNKPI